MATRRQIERAAKLIGEVATEQDWYIAAETGISIQRIQEMRRQLRPAKETREEEY